MQPKQFKITENGLKEIRKTHLLKMLPIWLIAVIVGLSIAFFTSKEKDGYMYTLSLAIPISLLSVGYGLRNGLKRQRQQCESYTLTIDANTIKRELLNTPTIQLYHREITSINKAKTGMITVKGTELTSIICIPPQVHEYDQLVRNLEEIKPLNTNPSSSFVEKYSLVLIPLVLGLMAAVFISHNKVLVTIGGLMLCAILIWSLYEGRRSENIDEKTKKGLWWIVIVLFSVLARVILTLAGFD